EAPRQRAESQSSGRTFFGRSPPLVPDRSFRSSRAAAARIRRCPSEAKESVSTATLRGQRQHRRNVRGSAAPTVRDCRLLPYQAIRSAAPLARQLETTLQGERRLAVERRSAERVGAVRSLHY